MTISKEVLDELLNDVKNADDLLDETTTDSDGNFELSGGTTGEYSAIDTFFPYTRLYWGNHLFWL